MTAIEKFNDEYRKLFLNERARLSLKWDAKKIEILERLKIIDIRWANDKDGSFDYIITLEIDGEQELFFNCKHFNVNTKFYFLSFNYKEVAILKEWWDDLDITDYIEIRNEELSQISYETAVKRIGLIIEKVKKIDDFGTVEYTLSNGETIVEKIDKRQGEEIWNI